MSNCFCHFNGYEVKDAAAREGLEQANTRLNNLVANSGEQTAGNEELIDIRVSADGTIYSTAGESVRSQIKKAVTNRYRVESANYTERMPDANNILEPCVYHINFEIGTTDIPLNLPYTTFNGGIDLLFTIPDAKSNTSGYLYYRQMLIGDDYIYTRKGTRHHTSATVSYNPWITIYNKETTVKEYIVDKSGNGDYTSLTDCIFSNIGQKCIIHVRKGVYDLITEYKARFGENCFESRHDGLPINDGTEIWMDSGAEVRFVYDGSNADTVHYFSPFIMKDKGGEIHGGKIICENSRYCIHDDVYGSSEYSRSVIDGVYMEYNNPIRHVVIGGGLGKSSHVTVQNCTIINKAGNVGYGIYYHNTTVDEGKSYVVVKDNYVNGSIAFKPHGPSTDITTVIACGNKCISIVKEDPETVDNMVVYEFNNATTE